MKPAPLALLLVAAVYPMPQPASAQAQASYCRQQANVIENFEREVASGNFSALSVLLFQFDCKGIESDEAGAACLEKIRGDYLRDCGLN